MARLPYTDVRGLAASAEQVLASAAGARRGPGAADVGRAARAGARGSPLPRSRMHRSRARARERGAAGARRRGRAGPAAPFPAATILELSSERVRCAACPAGAEVTHEGTPSVPVPDRERAARRPVGLEDAASSGKDAALRSRLRPTGDSRSPSAWAASRPRFFVDGARDPRCCLLAHILGAHDASGAVGRRARSRASLGAAVPYGTRAEHTSTPEPDGPYTGMALLREYFLLPEKFCFFELGGFSTALRGTSARRATVTLTFDEPLPAQAASRRAVIRAHCVPAVNLFRIVRGAVGLRAGSRKRAGSRGGSVARRGWRLRGPRGVRDRARRRRRCVARRAPAGAALRRRAAVERGFPYAFSTQLVSPPGAAEPGVVVCLTSPRGRPQPRRRTSSRSTLLATNRARAAGAGPAS